MVIKKIIFGLAFVACMNLFSACTSSNNNSNTDDFDIPDSLVNAPLQLSENVVNDMIENISSPVEMANEIKTSGAAFQEKILNSSDKVSDYSTSFKRALNLGAYSADLGYINTFNKSTIVISYLMAVKELADGINVGQFLDFTTLKRLATNHTNLDSLKQLSVSSFNSMDRYLRDQKRRNVSSAIVAGAWIEGIYITSCVVEETNNQNLINRLGEQKDIVKILKIILENFSKYDKNFQDLVAKMDDLSKTYDDVRITVERGEPIMVEKDGVLSFDQNEITHVDITPEQVKEIIAKVKDLRQFVIE